ncbi:amidinotransferase [Nocardia terpenica]|uniref:Amidinotransferase n=1 Tax=Nocardia terpenica TaxID=455432 RepID=A0A161WLF0_9NOCA|nr:amidinotransferase [Nocardia terpenica]KZM73875.1 amidinotransferase [Nocardia terpenica]NQE86840.1 amidinotransferase [Nocardia terpenica]
MTSATQATHDGSEDREVPASPVCSYNEWDPLEEVIVGIVDDASFPTWHECLPPVLPADQVETFRCNAGRSFPAERIDAARRDLEEFAHILEAEGVTVRRPEPIPQRTTYSTLDWSSTGMYAAMPRDALLVVGTEIIECPMAWRSRYYESLAYRPLLKEYFHGGAKWTAGPKPELTDAQFDQDWTDDHPDQGVRLVVTEFEPTFDAADFTRCGRDIIAQMSNVTNAFGIEWLQRQLGDEYRIHVFEFADTHPMHIDATLVPLAPGKLLVNPERVPKVPALFKNWDVLEAPRPIIPDTHPLYMTSKWINMNVLSLDEDRVMVEREDEPMIQALKDFGFTPIPCSFRNFNSFGGSFHCATLDVRRRGTLQSYF